MNKKNHVKFLGPIVIAALLNGCATTNRIPASINELTLTQLIEQIKITSDNHKLDQTVCKNIYEALNTRLFTLIGDTSFFDWDNVALVDKEIRSSFAARIALKEKIKDFDGSEECLKSVAETFAGLRYIEDYLIELRMKFTPNAPADYVSLTGQFPYLLVNPKYEAEFKSYEDLRSGDIILSRGNAYTSAAIARIGTNDFQFSHVSFVYKDPASPEIFTTEAHMEIGSVTAPIIGHINRLNSREAVFRYYDPEISHLASKHIYDRVWALQKDKKTIPYDFTMNYKDDEKVYCSEIISGAFKHVLKDEDYFPMYKSKFSPGMVPFLNIIGVPVTKETIGDFDAFAPADIQFDPRLELVAEWRNPKKMEESRTKDFILTKIFERMETESYKIDPKLRINTESKTLWGIRRLPIVKKLVAARFPLNMSTKQLQLFIALERIGDALYKKVQKASLGYTRAMYPNEIYAVLDQFFQHDFEVYERYITRKSVEKPLFHILFHP